MTAKVFLATNNTKKLTELRRILKEQNLDICVVTMQDVEPYPEPAEDEWTFAGNALIKARAGVAHSGLVTLADDSGLCVDALGGMPGVRSSRWAGMEHEDVANLELVLRQVDDVPMGKRSAQFRAVVALVTPDGQESTFEGVMTGHLANTPRGARGFGYDPIFVADDQVMGDAKRLRTNSELSPEEKDAISHRGRAIRAMLPALVQVLDLDKPARQSPRQRLRQA
ncbi:MAG: RdgB/HAM1 family non-canonical purine NTP pyrophosphatase [Propionibacteriaceae bacterium]|nr:RdgB/HAM1 family non-canonical purine NTP pyrophosphatase [Propionibacteriaceae bacterium]